MPRIREIVEKFNNSTFRGEIKFDEPLSMHTTMRTGGPASAFICPEDESSLISALEFMDKNKIRHFIIGGGSNLVFDDDGFEGAVISTERLNSINIIEENDEWIKVKCGSGVKTDDLVKFFAENSISGIETFSGLPGTVGGASWMNARCYGKDFSENLVSAEYIEITGIPENKVEYGMKLYHNEFGGSDWNYKSSPFMKNHGIITSVIVKGNKKFFSKIQLQEECRKYKADRDNKGHFKAPSAGSVFKNDRRFGAPSGKLIDEAGLKGLACGGAQIAPWHGNFIINCGTAKSQDIKSLVESAKAAVRDRTGFELETEIIFVDK